MMTAHSDIYRRAETAIRGGSPLDDDLAWMDIRFDAAVEAIFRHRYASNTRYRQFC